MRGNKGAFYCHLLPFITTYCHKTAKNVLVSSKDVLQKKHTPMDMSTYAREHGYC